MKKLIGCLSLSLLSIFNVPINALANTGGIQQAVYIVEFGTGIPQRERELLTQYREQLSLSVLTLDVDDHSAYSVWWVVFNEPQFCLTPYACGEAEVFEALGDLNEDQNNDSANIGFLCCGLQ